ncbi:MAG: acyloxyacyl hydrolase [Gemmataceae bacterium]
MRRIAAVCGILAAWLLLLPAGHAQDVSLLSTGSTPLVPAQTKAAQLPITLDLTLPSDIQWLANVNQNNPPPAETPAAPALAESPCAEDCGPEGCVHGWEIFHRGQTEMQFMTGVLGHPLPNIGPQGPTMIYLPELVRFGFMVNNSDPNRRLIKGSLEAIFEATTMPIVAGPGSILVGGALYGRYNFSTRFRRIVPYIQFGGGGSWSDSFKSPPSNLATGFEFILHGADGIHYLINSHWALSAEYDYYHFSNAGITRGNLGVNAFGGTIGITRFFR